MKPLFILSGLAFILSHTLSAQPPAPRPWSGGVFAATDSQPYRGADGKLRVFPFVSYRSQTLEWYGPFVRYRLTALSDWHIWLRGQVDFGAFDESDSPFLEGMGDRSTTLLMGLGVQRNLNPHWSMSLSADRDVFGAHDGLESVVGITRRIGAPFMPLSGSVSGGVRFQDKRWTRDRVAVSAEQARDNRPEYNPDLSVHPYLSAMGMFRISERWMTTAGLRYEWLDSSWTNSPLVSDRGRLTSIVTFSYLFF
jgi:outer membrane protein